MAAGRKAEVAVVEAGTKTAVEVAVTPGIRPYARCHDTHPGILWARARHTMGVKGILWG